MIILVGLLSQETITVRRFTDSPSLNRPCVYRVEFVNLQGAHETYDIEESIGTKESGEEDLWYGRELARRKDEVLYKTPSGRWVLVFVILPGHEDDPGPGPLERELTPAHAAHWLRLNGHALPAGTEPPVIDYAADRRMRQNRLDRDWAPAHATRDELTPAALQALHSSDPASAEAGEPRAVQAKSSTADKARPVSQRGDLEDRAMVLLSRHPDWSNKCIADELSCHPKSLSRFERFAMMRQVAAANRLKLPRGQKDRDTGRVEAWEDEDDG